VPYHRIVIAIDEFASFISQAKEAELLISRIAAEGRAAGMHLILATQRPSVDVVTGIIKANFSTRITYKVSSGKDSETVMDIRGAEKLLGRGDSLCMLPGSTEWQRVHSAYISPDEVKAVCAAWRAQSGKQAVIEPPAETESTAPAAPVQLSDDELMPQLRAYARGRQWVASSAVERKFRLGYNRAERVLEQLEVEGILGPKDPTHKKQRPVLNP
jgi:S-DNA-T family DNA segregation ATPase FtsK/SpoIIIE